MILYIEEQLASHRGVCLPGFCKFTKPLTPLDGEQDEFVFRLNQGFAGTHGLAEERPLSSSHAPTADVSYFSLAEKVGKPKEIVSMIARLLFMHLGEALSQQACVRISFGKLGVLCSSHGRVKFRTKTKLNPRNQRKETVLNKVSPLRISKLNKCFESKPGRNSVSQRKYYEELESIMEEERSVTKRPSSRRSNKSCSSRPSSAGSISTSSMRPSSRQGRPYSVSSKWEEESLSSTSSFSDVASRLSHPQITRVTPFPERVSHSSKSKSSSLLYDGRWSRSTKGPSKEKLERTMEEAVERYHRELDSQQKRERNENYLMEIQIQRNKEQNLDEIRNRKRLQKDTAQQLQQQIAEKKKKKEQSQEQEKIFEQRNKHNPYVKGIPEEPKTDMNAVWKHKLETKAALDAQVDEKNTRKNLERALDLAEENQMIRDSNNAYALLARKSK